MCTVVPFNESQRLPLHVAEASVSGFGQPGWIAATAFTQFHFSSALMQPGTICRGVPLIPLGALRLTRGHYPGALTAYRLC